MKKIYWAVIIILLLLFFLMIIARNRDDGGDGIPVNNGEQNGDGFILGPGDYEFTFQHEGMKRGYLLHVPSYYKKDIQIPLVLNFHGGGGSPEGHKWISDMDLSSDKYNYIVVYPRGTRTDNNEKIQLQRFWNIPDGPTGVFNRHPSISSIDDVGYVESLLDHVQTQFNIDKNRVYATGFSNGAILSHMLACELSDKIAAIAPVGGQFWNFPENCNPTRPISVVYFHGKQDPCAPYYGGESECEEGIAGGGRIFPTAQSSFDFWKNENGCSGSPEISYQNGEATCDTYTQCNQGTSVTLCSISDGGHTWPGGHPYILPGVDVGKTSYDIFANDAMWTVFENHPINK